MIGKISRVLQIFAILSYTGGLSDFLGKVSDKIRLYYRIR
jgi:hypothetical protein